MADTSLHVGTSGYSYNEWKGPFYPAKLPATQMAAYYAERFATVEVNRSFYSVPAASSVEGRARDVPPASPSP